MNPLIALLGQAAGVPMVQQGVEQVPGFNRETPPIVVTGNQQQGEPIPGMDNGMVLEDAQYAQEQAPPRTGMFGTKGTLRDILGTVGDAFLMQGGRDPIYSAVRRNEKMADAMAGFSQNPQAAMERLAAGGFNDEAMKIASEQRQMLQERINQGKLDATVANNASLADDRRWGNVKDATNIIARMFGSPQAQANPEAAIAQAELIAKQAGVDLASLGVSPGMTSDDMQLYSRRDMTVNQQEMLPRRDRQLAISQQNADTSRQNSNKPERPVTPTEAGEIARIRAKLNNGEPLSAGDKATWEKYMRPPRRGSSNNRRDVTVPSERTKGWGVRRN